MSQARVKLTQEEEDFFRVILYHAVSDEQAQPYLRKAFYRLIPVAVEGSRTMSIDEHWRVYIDFTEMMRRGSSYATGILHHEIWHPLRQHHKLAETLDAAPAGYNQGVIANLAADLEINDDIAHLIPANAIKGQRSVFNQYPENGIFAPYYEKMLEDLDYLEKYFPSIKETSVAQQPQQQGGGPPDEDQSGQDGETQEQASGEGPDGAEQPDDSPGSGGEEEASDSLDGYSEPSEGDSDSSDSEGSSSPSSSSSSEPQQNEENDQGQEGLPSSGDSSPGAGTDEISESGSSDSFGESDDSGSSSGPPPFPGQGSGQSQNPSQPGTSEPVKQAPPFPGTAQKPVSPFPKTSPEPQQAPTPEPAQGKSDSSSDQSDSGNIEESDYWDHPECGSSTGNPAEYELAPGEAPEMSESEEENLTRAVARDIQDWLKENSGVGSGQGNNSLGDWAEQRLKAKTIPWQQELRGIFLSAAATVRGKLLYVRNKPSRRQPVPEFMFPALKAPKPTIGIGIDVSGSNLGNLRVILDEIVKMMKSMNVQGRDVEAFAVDVAVSKTKTVSNPLKLLDDLPVGGGTRMKPGYMKLAEMGKDVSLLITDGWVDDYPEEQPKGKKRTKFITCIVMKERNKKNDSRVRKAKRIMGKWCKVIPIYVSEMKESSS